MPKHFWILLILLTACSNLATPETHTPVPTVSPNPTLTSTVIPTQTPVIYTATPTLFIPTKGSGSYTVQAGDTLEKISNETGISVIDLSRANKLSDPNLIYAGQTLLIATPEPAEPPQPSITDGKQIIVVLWEQKLYAYEDGEVLNSFLISTGTSSYPTITGEFEIYVKYKVAGMSGEGYNIPDVPYVMYFHKGYGLHGAYWHNNFGYPMSHGCVNLSVNDAKWLFDWAPVGTNVTVLP